MVQFINFGISYPDINPIDLKHDCAKKTLSACTASKDFQIIETRYLTVDDGGIADIIVVDCLNDQVPTRNHLGIKVRERLALVFTANQERAPEVRALRADFPVCPHMNHVAPGQPASLCLYFEPWSAVKRTWTPHKHLQRILWWLSQTAKDALHRTDQPVEQLYFEAPYEIILPPDFEEKINNQTLTLTLESVQQSTGGFKVIRGCFLSTAQAKKQKQQQFIPLVLTLNPVQHGSIERYPNTLGELHDQLVLRGTSFINNLWESIRSKVDQNGIVKNPYGRCLLIFNIPITRSAETVIERHETRAFLILEDLTVLGESAGALTNLQGKFYATTLIGKASDVENEGWRDLEIHPVDVKSGVTKDFTRNVSRIMDTTADFKGVLAGVGALGSNLADLWAKESWGEWSFIDPDIVKAHNIVRHIARDWHIGHFKVDSVKCVVEANYQNGYYSVMAIPDSVTNWLKSSVKDVVTTAAFLVDATTTLDVPRDLSQRDDVPRSCSLFLTPSGHSSVLLLEDDKRKVRLESLEAQYYRSIINSDWGTLHLEDDQGTLWVGAGCRDVSAVISYETIQLHAATLARQVRLLRDQSASRIRVWTADMETGALTTQEVPVHETLRLVRGDWQIVWDTEIRQKLWKIRKDHLPSETGGVILGYIDQSIKAIYLVDVLPAPPDSEADQIGFTRGIEGLNSILDEAARRTANLVGYIGEWHSHPPSSAAWPSQADIFLLSYLADALARDGQPALMVIVAETEITMALGKGV